MTQSLMDVVQDAVLIHYRKIPVYLYHLFSSAVHPFFLLFLLSHPQKSLVLVTIFV